jgi:hypothetical protein
VVWLCVWRVEERRVVSMAELGNLGMEEVQPPASPPRRPGRGLVAAPGVSRWPVCESVRMCMEKLNGHVNARWNRQSRCLRWVPLPTHPPPPTLRHA